MSVCQIVNNIFSFLFTLTLKTDELNIFVDFIYHPAVELFSNRHIKSSMQT